MTKPNIIQLHEFDITQKIIESLSNVCTRAVLFSIKNPFKLSLQKTNRFRRINIDQSRKMANLR